MADETFERGRGLDHDIRCCGAGSGQALWDETIATPFGVVQLEHSFPADEPSVLLFDLDAQRAAQAYFWSLPLVGFAVFRDEQARVYEAARFGDFVVFDSLREKRGIVTANLTTPYILNWTDLSDRPALIDYPPGQTAGGVLDFWQRPVADLGLTGPDQGKGGNYMVIAPREDASRHADSGRIVIQSATSNVMIGLRLLNPDPQAEAESKAALAMSRLGEEPRPGARPVAAQVDGRWMLGTSGVHGGSIRVTSSVGRSLSCWLGSRVPPSIGWRSMRSCSS